MTDSHAKRPNRRMPYRFGFVLNTTLGNMTRYLNLRKYAERDEDVVFTWAPVSHYTPPDSPSRLRVLPGPLFMRARLIQQMLPVMRHLDELDAVMIHLFEAEILCGIRSYFRKTPLRISSTDEAPIIDRGNYPLYPNDLRKAVWRQQLRLAIDLWRVGRTDLFIPFSQWVADTLVQGCGAPRERVHPLHVGLDLERWHCPPKPEHVAGARLTVLFVGGDFVRKGGALLLEVFNAHFQDSVELHLVTRQAPAELPLNVHVHADFQPNDERLVALYARADLLVVPTTADTGPLWVFMEAMSMGLPIIGTDTGSNTELVRQGETGLIVKIGDGESLATAIKTLSADAAMRRRMGANGRRLIETKYDAGTNVPLILETMKRAVDAARLAATAPRA
jgi:glycosyltransferase involved in cell wall biosynthesis